MPSTGGAALEETEVVVVAGGGAGRAAAIEAATLGRKVVLLEKNPRLGGSTAWSVGSITATLTPHQIEAGILDCPRDHHDDVPGFAGRWRGRDNEELRRVLTEHVPETFRWLLSLGVVFFGPMPEPPHRRPRMHTVLPNSRVLCAGPRQRFERAEQALRKMTGDVWYLGERRDLAAAYKLLGNALLLVIVGALADVFDLAASPRRRPTGSSGGSSRPASSTAAARTWPRGTSRPRSSSPWRGRISGS